MTVQHKRECRQINRKLGSTDAHGGYRGLLDAYKHEFVDHAVEYVRDNVHTNGMENFWSLLKRGLKGTYMCRAVTNQATGAPANC